MELYEIRHPVGLVDIEGRLKALCNIARLMSAYDRLPRIICILPVIWKSDRVTIFYSHTSPLRGEILKLIFRMVLPSLTIRRIG